ncbi:MAG: hypothetical protein IJ165_14000 [Proteobacteria bacterium]|nr:hypothetical protein [Pseudomonadota bacterium]
MKKPVVVSYDDGSALALAGWSAGLLVFPGAPIAFFCWIFECWWGFGLAIGIPVAMCVFFIIAEFKKW